MATTSSVSGPQMHKNRLQEYTQKSSLPLPIYKTVNEGFQHAPKFRATVLVDDTEYMSQFTFLQRKAAEQDVAKLALECISRNMKNNGCPIINQDPIRSKAILYEFATKKNLKIPIFKTTSPQGSTSGYISSLTFNGETYTGKVAGSKKVAEQLAARTAIQSLIGSDSGDFLAQIIKSKYKGKLSPKLDPTENISLIDVETGNSTGNLTNIPKSSTGRGKMDLSSVGKRRVEIGSKEAKRTRRFGD